MCKKRLFTPYLHYNCEGHASTIFTTRYLDEIQGSNEPSSTWFHQTGLHSGEDKSFQLHIGQKKKKKKKKKHRRILRIFSKQVSSTMGDPSTFHDI